MFVFIASVHHTGTQFTEKLFKDAGFGPTDKAAVNGQNDYHRAHIADSVATELKDWLERGFPLVVPLRHPMEVAKSWLRRKKPIPQMVRQFELLVELVDPYKPMYLPLDHEFRERYLAAIRRECGTQIVTDWAVHASKREGGPHKAQLTLPEPSAADIELLVALAHTPLLNNFYPEPWELWL